LQDYLFIGDGKHPLNCEK